MTHKLWWNQPEETITLMITTGIIMMVVMAVKAEVAVAEVVEEIVVTTKLKN